MPEWLFGVDESGTQKSPVYGFGALMMRWERRGDLHRLFDAIVASHPGHLGEVKWKKTSSAASYDLACDLVDFFFERKWLAFHCMVVRKELIEKHHHRDYDEAWRKNLCEFLVNKSKLCARSREAGEHTVRVWADDIPSRYAKAAEALDNVANNKLRRFRGGSITFKISEHDSKEKPAIQLCDLLLGAVVQSWGRSEARGNKRKLQQRIAERLGWEHLRNGTYAQQKKFNIWHLHDHGPAGRRVSARPVNLT